ncbi:hypothetical protein GGI20_003855 [Coemansia sp. BCRC 34301]|nr:hypothetical protein GGI20_003855 [Coemansia sp. BCRC 34301]
MDHIQVKGALFDLDAVLENPEAKTVKGVMYADNLLVRLSCHKCAVVVADGKLTQAQTKCKQASLLMPRRVVTASDVAKGKPRSEYYKAAAALLNIEAKEALVFVGSAEGLLAAKEAGAQVVAICKTPDMRKRLEEAGAIYMVEDYSCIRVSEDDNDMLVFRVLE